MKSELKVIADFYDFMLWLIRQTEKFPRHHRYSLGLAMENRLQTILSLLLRAEYSKAKAEGEPMCLRGRSQSASSAKSAEKP